MRATRFNAATLRPWLWGCLCVCAATAPQSLAAEQPAADQPAGVPEISAPATPPPGRPWAVVERPPLATAAESPPMACYLAAHRRQGDAYDCDLAVQVARDSGSPAALAAALTNRALVLTRTDRLEPALADLDAAIAQTPDDPAIHGNRGNLLLRLGRPAEALQAHDRAIELAPRDPRGYYNRAFSYLALGEPLRAEQEVAAARSLLERQSPVTPASRQAAGTPALDAGRGP